MKIIQKSHLLGHLFICFSLFFVLKSVSNVFLQPYVVNDWKSILFSDKAGYNIYLPATFIYKWDGYNIPEKLPDIQGNAFSINKSGKIITKYTVGSAYLQSPFFIYTYARNYNKNPIGNEREFNIAVFYSVLFYTVMGLLLLAETFRKRSDNFWLGWFISLLVFFSTNLFYYTVKAPGYSHSYSFFLFSLLLYILPIGVQKIRAIRWVAIGIIVGLIFTVRPINILFAVLYIAGILLSREDRWPQLVADRWKIILAVTCAIVPLIPQMIYWKYAFGYYFTNSYKGEGFTLWQNPNFEATFMSTNNGLFVFTPIWILFFISIFFLFNKKTRIMGSILSMILVSESYLCSSWSSPYFGCSFGHRVFVDVLPFAALGLFLVLQTRMHLEYLKKTILVLSIFLFSALCIVYTQRICINYPGCWNHGELYDYDTFKKELIDQKPEHVTVR